MNQVEGARANARARAPWGLEEWPAPACDEGLRVLRDGGEGSESFALKAEDLGAQPRSQGA